VTQQTTIQPAVTINNHVTRDCKALCTFQDHLNLCQTHQLHISSTAARAAAAPTSEPLRTLTHVLRLRFQILKSRVAETEDVAKAHLVGLMAEWLNEKVALADRVLVEHAVSKVYDGDVILTYAYSQVRGHYDTAAL
jgi:hypothetical protein